MGFHLKPAIAGIDQKMLGSPKRNRLFLIGVLLFCTSVGNSKMNSYLDPVLVATAKKVGIPPRRFSSFSRKYAKGSKPVWLTEKDLISSIYKHEKEIIRRGIVRWAVVVQANDNLFQPRLGTSGAQAVYCPSGEATLEQLKTIARRCFELKGTTPEAEDELRLANMLTDELERALDWQVPSTLTGELDVITSIVMIPRELVPRGVLGLSYFPVIVDPITKMALLVPSHYWEKTFYSQWEERADLAISQLQDQVPMSVVLTPAAAEQVRSIIKGNGLKVKKTWLRVGIEQHDNGAFSYKLNFENSISSKDIDYTFESAGIPVVIEKAACSYLDGTTIDYVDDENSSGFKFINPQAMRTD